MAVRFVVGDVLEEVGFPAPKFHTYTVIAVADSGKIRVRDDVDGWTSENYMTTEIFILKERKFSKTIKDYKSWL